MVNVNVSKFHGGVGQRRICTVSYFTETSGPGVDSISCLAGQAFLGKRVCWTPFPCAHIALRSLL